jgi:uncharacterized Zn-binding protein involved in type VI secretion
MPDGNARRASNSARRWANPATRLPDGAHRQLPAARATDMCVCVGPPDSIAMGSPTVLIGNLMAARMGDPTVHGGVITLGLPTVMIGVSGQGSPLNPGPPAAAFRQAAAAGTPLVCKGPCPACGHM